MAGRKLQALRSKNKDCQTIFSKPAFSFDLLDDTINLEYPYTENIKSFAEKIYR